ncbi:MAG: response regulator [Bacteroidales bacterium]|nr:response regulator [Bacteroidales bacterium]
MKKSRVTQIILRLQLLLSAILMPVTSTAVSRLPESALEWKNISVDGRKKAVFCLYRDSCGVVWLGTNGGLYFYDGVATHPVGQNDFGKIQVYAIVERGNSLLLGTNNGLLLFDYMTGLLNQSDITTPSEIRTLLLEGDSLWIGGLNGISLLDLSAHTIKDCSKGLPHRSVYSLLRDSRGILYAGTYGGVARLDTQRQQFSPLKIHYGGSETQLFANCLLESEDRESIYVGGEGSLFRYTPASDSWEKIAAVESKNVKSLANGEPGHLLAGTDDGVFDISADNVRHYRHDTRQDNSLGDNEIWSIYYDDNHNLWTGHERGVSIASNSSAIRVIKLGTLTQSGEGNEIYGIFRDSRDNMWFAGTNGVICLAVDGTPRWFRHGDMPNTLSHNRVRDMKEDSGHNIWLATDAGINRYNADAGNFDVFHIVDKNGEHDSNWVYALAEDGDYLWVGSFLNGLHYINKAKLKGSGRTVVADKVLNSDTRSANGLNIDNNLINNVIRDHDGNLWILLFRDNIIARYNPLTDNIVKYNIHDIAGGYPTHISIDTRGRVWCAFKGGAVIFNRDGSHRVVRFPYTNSDESVLAMGSVASGMWISTLNNVWSIDGDSFGASLLPLPQKSYTAIYEDSKDGSVYLGGTDEIVRVGKEVMQSGDGYKTIRMVLDDNGSGQLDFAGMRGGETRLAIPYGGGMSLVVSTLDYSPASQQRYMYKLVESPADSVGNWVVLPAGVNTITYTGLNPGRYNVLVRAVGSPGATLSIPLTVASPAYLSWWAISLYILLIIGIICWIVWYLRKKNQRTLREQERQIALENVERKLTFLSSISHDLKTPLSMIIGPVSMMKERAHDPETRKTLETVYDNAVRLNNMIHRTLELQHLEDNEENLLIISIFDVVEFCRGVFEVFRENNPRKKYMFHSSSRQILVEADAVKFESVIANLLSNAGKYSDDGATISCGIIELGDRVEIVVSDDGVGISDMDQPLVFQRMFRSPATAALREGTGLGLYLIKKYLDMMHGTIDLYSKEGQGTSFVVTLPVASTVAAEATAGDDTEVEGRPKILVVDDNMQISGFITGILKEEFTCLTADNGRSGLAIAASFLPDLIIVDEMMPIMSGMEMVKRLKQNPRLAYTPVIMLTAKNDSRTENESIQLGIDVFMSKPFEPSALVGRIRQLLKGRAEIKEKVRIQAITEAESKPIEAESINEKSLARIAKIIEENISDPDLNVNFLCEKSGLTNKQLYRLIKKYMGTAPLDYIRRVRLQKAAMLLSQHRFTVAEICYMVGFKTPSYFAKCFQTQYGVAPSQYVSDDTPAGNI